jgi:hypothetical protein
MQGDSTAEKGRFASPHAVYERSSGKDDRGFSVVSGFIAESYLTCWDASFLTGVTRQVC